jgi:hypothetical protein
VLLVLLNSVSHIIKIIVKNLVELNSHILTLHHNWKIQDPEIVRVLMIVADSSEN